MRWPWVSRLALDMVMDERDRLREKNDELTDHITRLVRKDHGMTERKRDKVPVKPMPEKIQKMLARFGSPTLRGEYDRQLRHKHQQDLARGMDANKSWERLERELAEALPQ